MVLSRSFMINVVFGLLLFWCCKMVFHWPCCWLCLLEVSMWWWTLIMKYCLLFICYCVLLFGLTWWWMFTCCCVKPTMPRVSYDCVLFCCWLMLLHDDSTSLPWLIVNAFDCLLCDHCHAVCLFQFECWLLNVGWTWVLLFETSWPLPWSSYVDVCYVWS